MSKKIINQNFISGFEKGASPHLVEMSYDADGSEDQARRQAILEASYEDDKGVGLSKEQKKRGKVVKEGPSSMHNPSATYLMERS